MPSPLSVTRISFRPPSRTSTEIRVAPASREFSISSFTTDDGRSTTSPAAIWFAISSGKILILGIVPELQTQIPKLLLGNLRRRSRHQVCRPGRLREGDDVTQRCLTSEDHDHSIQAQRNSAMRRGAVLQGFQEKAELVARFLFRKAESSEDSRLNIAAVNSYGAAADLRTVQHEIVGFGSHLFRITFEKFKVLVQR